MKLTFKKKKQKTNLWWNFKADLKNLHLSFFYQLKRFPWGHNIFSLTERRFLFDLQKWNMFSIFKLLVFSSFSGDRNYMTGSAENQTMFWGLEIKVMRGKQTNKHRGSHFLICFCEYSGNIK